MRNVARDSNDSENKSSGQGMPRPMLDSALDEPQTKQPIFNHLSGILEARQLPEFVLAY